MKFYDRENEQQVLGEVLQQSRREARMTVLIGRRRIGKTELSQRCGDDTVLYFFVGKKAEALLCQDYVREIRSAFPIAIRHMKTISLSHLYGRIEIAVSKIVLIEYDPTLIIIPVSPLLNVSNGYCFLH